jgi:hypothetical protein
MPALRILPDRWAGVKLHDGRGVCWCKAIFGEIVLDFLAFAATLAATIFGYLAARRFVRDRLKFVDGVQTLKAPLIAGVVAWAIAWPVTLLLPLVGAGTALLFGVSVALGVRSGARDIRIDRRITGGL